MSDQFEMLSTEEMIPWKAEWKNMPEYAHKDLMPKFQIIVSFSCEGDVVDFAELTGIPAKPVNGKQTRSYWFPEQEIGQMANKRFIQADHSNKNNGKENPQ